jgi:hypothetical protein
VAGQRPLAGQFATPRHGKILKSSVPGRRALRKPILVGGCGDV